jgi:hypothetical protein
MWSLALFLLLLCSLAVLIASCLTGLVFAGVTAMVIRRVDWRRRVAFSAASALPFACWALLIAPFVLWWIYAERSSFLGFSRLPNGYTLMMINAIDPGWLYKPVDNLPQQSWPKDALDGVETLQVAGRYMIGGRDSHGLNFGKLGGRVDSYFVLDGETRQLTTLSSFQELQSTASRLDIPLRLEAVRVVYFKYGPTDPTKILRFFVFPLLLVLIWLLPRWIVRVRRFNRHDGATSGDLNVG